jgi:putative ABC transport system ATP-binding protein
LSLAPLYAVGISRSIVAAGSRFTLLIERFELAEGARIAVVGPSGCGKSTLLALLALALRPDAGEALALTGTDALALWRTGQADGLATLRARVLGFVPQTGALLPFLSLHDNIQLPQRILDRPDPTRIASLAKMLGIEGILHRKPGAVSVGQRQRAAVARALAHRPSIVLADEPTASVHPAQADDILDLLTKTAAEDGAVLVITTHDAPRALAAGYAIVPCEPDADQVLTRFCWPARSLSPP